ncbi:MAG: TrkH family potassium uptake protein [candidate division WOR-3 bacterium]
MKRRFNPTKILIGGYAGIILLGALLLLLPWSRNGHLSPLDALFTSTSAVCVTGLIVKDTATFFTTFGKLVIITLIQIGGLSYMTFATLFLFLVGKKGSLVVRSTMAASYPDLSLGEIYRFAKRIVVMTLVIETAGFILLSFPFVGKYGFPAGLAHAAFHAISAFCNAGFSTFSDSLVSWRGNVLVNLTLLSLIVIGGLGFVAVDEYYNRFIKRNRRKLSLHGRMVAAMTLGLIIVGFIAFLAFEWTGAMADFSVKEKILSAMFMAITPRTAGFNTIDYPSLSPFSLLLTIALMIIGASPGGTSGGIKTTTVAVVFLRLMATLTGKHESSAWGYRIGADAIRKAYAVFVLALAVVAVDVLALSLIDPRGMIIRGFIPYLFEVASAFGTVGLSLGSFTVPGANLSADLPVLGKCVIIITMLIGRLGVLSIFMTFVTPSRDLVRYVEGKVVIG